MENTVNGKALKEKLFYKNENAWEKADKETVMNFCEGYKDFISTAKIEREAVKKILSETEADGYKKFDKKNQYKPGDKAYINNRGKAVALIKFGEECVCKGIKILAAHIDSPRLDLKPNPVYEEDELCYMKTHYYGGIRKYQWPSIPLALHGVIIKKGGEEVCVSIGEDSSDPCFTVNDLLPHLAKEQYKKTLAEAFTGENLNVLIGNYPFKCDDESEKVKLNVLNILFTKYGIKEKDFLTAELAFVPAFKACDIGFDKSLVGGYGQDDRVCAYTAYKALTDTKIDKLTTLVLLVDKEEIGSEGNTGMNSDFLRNIAEDLAYNKETTGSEILRNSKCLSADVSCGYDPNYPSVYDKKNSAFAGHGVVIMKYTGAGGKSDTSDASAEYMRYVTDILDNSEVCWQTGELGAVDAGGGGTVAKYIANLGVDTIDVGVPVLAMHSPFEVTSKADIYMTYKAFCEFIK